jgi:nitrous oxide reductase accessory protein NosL
MSSTLRISMAAAMLALLTMPAVACGPSVQGPPEIVVDQTSCAHCLMLISDLEYAAAYRAGEEVEAFDDIACLLRELDTEADEEEVGIWFRDVRDASWLEPAEAIFVLARSLPTPMAGGVVAVGDRSAATALADQHGGEVIESFEALRDRLAQEGSYGH